MPNELEIRASTLALSMTDLGLAANAAAARHTFADHLSRKAPNTVERYQQDLTTFSTYLAVAGVSFDPAIDGETFGDQWQLVTWGIVEGFAKWMLQQGYAVGSINSILSTIKVFSRLAARYGAITPGELTMIKTVRGYAGREGYHIDQHRDVTRIGEKKAESILPDQEQAEEMKAQPLTTPIGRRDAVLMCILLDHGLRCGEVALLQRSAIDLKRGTITFYRPKVHATQTHDLTDDAQRALKVYLAKDVLADGPLVWPSKKGGELRPIAMSERGITRRVNELGMLAGVTGMSAHDCRHYWATMLARSGTDAIALMHAGGWSSLVMPARYVKAAEIANRGVKYPPKLKKRS